MEHGLRSDNLTGGPDFDKGSRMEINLCNFVYKGSNTCVIHQIKAGVELFHLMYTSSDIILSAYISFAYLIDNLIKIAFCFQIVCDGKKDMESTFIMFL